MVLRGVAHRISAWYCEGLLTVLAHGTVRGCSPYQRLMLSERDMIAIIIIIIIILSLLYYHYYIIIIVLSLLYYHYYIIIIVLSLLYYHYYIIIIIIIIIIIWRQMLHHLSSVFTKHISVRYITNYFH